MSDLPKRKYPSKVDRLHADTELALKRVRDDLNATASYTPADATDWSSDPPTTIGDALDRIAAALGPIA